MGDEQKLIEILGVYYHAHEDETKRTVAHFAAFGGQLPLLKKMVETQGIDAINEDRKLINSPPLQIIKVKDGVTPCRIGNRSQALKKRMISSVWMIRLSYAV